MATYDAGDARLRIVPDAKDFRKDLDAQMRSQKAEFVLQVTADAERAKEEIDKMRREEEARSVDVRVNTTTAQARQDIDRMRAEQEARAMHLRVEVDRSQMSGLSQAVENARQQVINANDSIVASERRIATTRRQTEGANDAIAASERRIGTTRRQFESDAQKVILAERNLAQLRQTHAAEIHPLLAAAERALERSRAKGNPEGIERSERNLIEMRKALMAPTSAIENQERRVSEARRVAAASESRLTQEIANGVGARRRAEQAESNHAAAMENTTRARRRAEQASQRLASTIDQEIAKSRDMSRELKTLGKDFESTTGVGAFAEAFLSAVPVIGMLPAMATGLAEVGGAMQQLAGASLVLPGVFAGVGASLGTLLVGVIGVGDAYKALSRESTQSGEEQRQQAIAVRQANEQLASATHAQGEAERERTRAVRDSRQEMQDLNLELRGGQIDTAEAILNAQKARRDLFTGHYKDGLDYQEAQLRIVQADQRVAESLNNQNKIRTRSADIGDRVVSANDRVTQANKRVADAQEHLNDVSTKVSASQRALNDAMGKLAPNAQEFVRTIFEMAESGPLKELRTETSQNLFAGMGASIRTLVNADLPTLKAGMGTVATSLNGDFKQLFASLGTDHSKGVIASIFGDTAHAQDLLKTAINPLVSAFGDLARAGADTLPRMADGVGRASERFKTFIEAADKDGRLDHWINGGITGFTHLGDIFINLGQSLSGITKALGGQGFMATFDDLTKKWAAWLNSAKGQDDLARIFSEGRREMAQLKPILEALPDIFRAVFGVAKDTMNTWLPVLQTVTSLLKEFPGLTTLIGDGFIAWKGLGPVLGLVGDGIGALGTKMGGIKTEITNARVLAGTEMSTTAKIFSKVAGEEGVGKLTKALNTLSGIGGPVGMAAVMVALPLAETAFENLTQKTRDAAAAAHQLDSEERNLENTLDRVTGKITASTRQDSIKAAQSYDQAGAGGGIAGISKGNAVEAATKLGIPPDVYADALTGNQNAIDQVRSILFKNNLGPEFQANKEIRETLGGSHGAHFSAEELFNALIGAPGAVQHYSDLVKAQTGAVPEGTEMDLTHIAQQLSSTGQASVLAGLAMTHQQTVIGGSQTQQQQGQQADQGRWRLSGAGQQELGLPASTQVNSANDGYHVSLPSVPDALATKLKQLNLTPTKNFDGSYTFVLPKGSPDVEKYDKGGGTPHATGPLADGGYPAVIHPKEYVANPTGRATLGDAFLGKANQGVVDLSLLPHFGAGGPGDVMPLADPSNVPGPPGPYFPTPGMRGPQGDTPRNPGPARVLPPPGGWNAGYLPHFDVGGPGDKVVEGDELGPTGPAPTVGGPLAAIGAATSGAQGPLNSLLNSGLSSAGLGNIPGLSGLNNGAGASTAANPGMGAGMGAMPGLLGLGAASQSPEGMQAWQDQSTGWLANWGGKYLGQFATTLFGGVLGAFGLDKSILSPSNSWNRDSMSVVNGLWQHLGGAGMGGMDPAVAAALQNGSLDPAALAAAGGGIPGLTGATAGATAGAGAQTPGGQFVAANPASRANIQLGGTTTSAVSRAGLKPLYTPGTAFGYGAQPAAGAGVPPSILQLADQFGLEASTYADGGSLHQAGFAFDFRPKGSDFGPEGRARMDAFSQFIQTNLGSQTLELIHYDPGSAGTNIAFDPSQGKYWGMAGAKPVDHPGDQYQGYFTKGGEGYSGHTDHVHWATDAPVVFTATGTPGAAGAIPNLAAEPGGVNPAALGTGPGSRAVSGAHPQLPFAGVPTDLNGLKKTAYQLYIAAGLPAGEWSAFDQLIQHESSWSPTAQNPGSTAYGLGQFLNTTWASVGGSKTDDPIQQLQYIFSYLKGRSDYHGSPAAAWSLWQSRSPHWYDVGGDWPTGTVGFNTSGHTETVLNHDQTQDMHQALTTAAQHINDGASQPIPQGPTAQHMQQPGIPQGPPPTAQHMQQPPGAPGESAPEQPTAPATLAPLGPQAQPEQGGVTPGGAGPTKGTDAWGPDSGMHVAPALKTGITSTAGTLGNLAGMAISAAAAAGSMGAGGGAGGGALGSLVSGLFQEGGKIAVDIANVPSSLMVGTLTPGTTANPSGQTYHPSTPPPPTGNGGNVTNYGGFYGHNTNDVLDALDLRQSQEQQSHLANHRSWP